MPYVTPDERKLNEADMARLRCILSDYQADYFNLFVGRLLPNRFDALAKLDRLLLLVAGHLGFYLGARVVLSGTISK